MFALLLFCFINYDGIVSNNPGKLHHIFLVKNIYQIILNHLSAAHNMDCYKPSLFLENRILSFCSISWCHDNSLFYWHSPYDHSVSIDTWFHIFYMIYFVPKLFILEISLQLRTKNASSYWRTITIHCALSPLSQWLCRILWNEEWTRIYRESLPFQEEMPRRQIEE